MAFINLSTDNVKYQSVGAAFEALYMKEGSMLLPLFRAIPVVGDMQTIRLTDTVGGVHERMGPHEQVQYDGQVYGKRLLKPKHKYKAMLKDPIQMAELLEDPALCARLIWNDLSQAIDEVILYGNNGVNGLAGNALSFDNDNDAVGHTVALPEKQYIAYDNMALSSFETTVSDPGNFLKYGLSTSKLIQASRMLRQAQAFTSVCICSNYAASTLVANPQYGNLQFNYQPAMATAQTTPFGGIQRFVTTDHVKSGVPSIRGDGALVEHAYVVDLLSIIRGFKAAFPDDISLSFDVLPQQFHNIQILAETNVDCVRMKEDAVVVIEVLSA
jgi:hypothetical protein